MEAVTNCTTMFEKKKKIDAAFALTDEDNMEPKHGCPL